MSCFTWQMTSGRAWLPLPLPVLMPVLIFSVLHITLTVPVPMRALQITAHQYSGRHGPGSRQRSIC